jgi:hypothetical protein
MYNPRLYSLLHVPPPTRCRYPDDFLSAHLLQPRDGTQITDIAYQPCDNNPSRDSVCCGTNHQGAGQTKVTDDVCEANGLCQNYEPFDGTNEGVQMWWRQGCTDPTWESRSV